jgi:hypothetical protein
MCCCLPRSAAGSDDTPGPTRKRLPRMDFSSLWLQFQSRRRTRKAICWLFAGRGEATEVKLKLSAPSGFRTPDPLIKSQLLYQLS